MWFEESSIKKNHWEKQIGDQEEITYKILERVIFARITIIFQIIPR